MKLVSALSLAAILTLAATPSAQAEDLYLEIYNDRGVSIDSVWVAPSSTRGNWATSSSDVMEDEINLDFAIVTINNVDLEDCEYDISVHFTDGIYQCIEGVDLCETVALTFVDLSEFSEVENEAACDSVTQ